MSWILGLVYCGLLWLVFAKLKLLRLSLPLAILAASLGPALIIALLFCAVLSSLHLHRSRLSRSDSCDATTASSGTYHGDCGRAEYSYQEGRRVVSR